MVKLTIIIEHDYMVKLVMVSFNFNEFFHR